MMGEALLTAAMTWHDAGCCVVPAKPDGSKQPWSKWKTYQQTRSTPEALQSWFSGEHFDGLGLVCGHVSGNLEMFEIEGRAATAGLGERLADLMRANGLEQLWRRITDGYLEQTPSGGYHWLLRIDGECRPPTKLAVNAAGECLIETKGEGGFTIVAPSGGRTHPTGQPWQVKLGRIGSFPTITEDERDSLYAVATLLDESPPAVDPGPRPAGRERGPDDPLRPGDDFNARAEWADVLTAHGWAQVMTFAGGARGWVRPGKNKGISATTGRNDGDNLYVFSSSTVFDTNKPITKFAAYATLNHGGDYSAAARDLASQGYGERTERRIYAVPDFNSVPGVDGTAALAEQTEPEATPAGPTGPVSPAELAARAHENRVLLELQMLRARHDAKKQHTAELVARDFRAPAYTRSLTDELLIPDEPVTYAIESLLPTGGNALLAAQFKAGKTTLVHNLLRAYADGTDFLGRFMVAPGAGRIGIFNYELSPDQHRRWLRDIGIVNTDRVAVLNLRGYRLPLTTSTAEDWVVQWLVEQEVSFWIADPFARAATGVDENSNTDVGVWLDTFDVIKERAGVSEAVLPTHTGRAEMEQGQERARGATRLDDWADVRWLLTKDEEGDRFFRATGRDVDLAEEQLHYDPLQRHLTMGGGDRKWRKQRRREQSMLEWIVANPGCGSREIEVGVGTRNGTSAVVKGLVSGGYVRVEKDGVKCLHFATGKALT